MSGKVDELGYHRKSVCKGCGQSIEWGRMFGKAHPFNLDGSSHFDSCPEADTFRKGYGPSLLTLGDRDTFYRQRWRAENYCDTREFDRSVLRFRAVPTDTSLSLAKTLVGIGGPLHYSNFPVGFIQQCFTAAGFDRNGQVVAVSCDHLILFRLRDYFHESAFRPYCVNGVFLV